MSEFKKVKLENIKPGPTRTESLPVELLNRARRIYELTYEVQYSTYEEFETNFRRDVIPETEIIVWEKITSAYLRFTEFKNFPFEKKKAAFMQLILLSLGTADKLTDNQYLSASEIEKLMSLYKEKYYP